MLFDQKKIIPTVAKEVLCGQKEISPTVGETNAPNMRDADQKEMKPLQQIAAEEITKQTLAQLSASEIVQLLGVDKLQDILKHTCETNRSMVLAALPNPTETMWIKDIDEWFYVAYGSSPIRLQWNLYSSDIRSIQLYDDKKKATTAVATTAYEVQSVIVPKMKKYDIKDDAVDDLLIAAADYFSRGVPDGGKKWVVHSNVLGRR